MAFTGDLEHLNIVDIIQLLNATRQSGIFSVKAGAGESRIVFSNGTIVGANHVDSSVRIGSVLVKTGAITVGELRQAMAGMQNAGTDRQPLLATLVRNGAVKREDALRGLKTLVEMTIVELMGWPKGTFTFDTDTPVVPTDGEVELGVEAQMVLMDALRIYDERERDRAEGKEVPSFASLYADVLPGEGAPAPARTTVTADDLGLADIDRLEKKIPRPVSEMEIFDPNEIQRRKLKELLPGIMPDEQDVFASFLNQASARKSGAAKEQAGGALILFSGDAVLSHAVLSLGGGEGALAFATDDPAELDRMVSQCLLSARVPVVAFDDPSGDGGPSREKTTFIRNELIAKHSAVPVLQFAPGRDGDFILQSYREGVRAVLPRPSKEEPRATYIQDTIRFLEAFRSCVRGLQQGRDDADLYGRKLKEGVALLRGLSNPSDAALVVLTAVSDMFERAVTLLVRPAELTGERAIGIDADKSLGPTPAERLTVQLEKPSVFRDVIEKERVHYGEGGDETLRTFFTDIGRPASPVILLLPLVCERRVIGVIYGDFGQKQPAPVRLDMLEILALQAGMVLEHALFRRQSTKASQKP